MYCPPYSGDMMSTLLFKLRNVPDDEAEDIRALLNEHQISFYETTAGSWGISLPAIWLHDKNQLQASKIIIHEYQKQRTEQAQASYNEQCNAGTQRTFWDILRENPIKFIGYSLAILFILYLASIPVSFLFS